MPGPRKEWGWLWEFKLVNAGKVRERLSFPFAEFCDTSHRFL